MTPQRLAPYALLLFTLLATPSAALTINGAWTQEGQSFVSPPVDDIEAFRSYFLSVLRLYQKYEPIADELAAGIESVGNIRVTAAIEENEEGFGADLSIENVGFNPLATGGTAEIATGGDFIDKQLDSQKHNFEMAEVEVEPFQFKQEFGQVQASRRFATVTAGGSGLEFFDFNFQAIYPLEPFPSASSFTGNPTATFSVVPEPSSMLLGVVGLLGLVRRRR